MRRKALGKGLRSLIPEAPPRSPEPSTADRDRGRELRQIDIDLIRPNRKQPRQQFDQAALWELANSLKTKGFIQPLVVRPVGDDRFEIVAGERRWRAAQQAGLHKVPAVVREVPDDQLLEVALVENLQREDLNPMDQAQAYKTLIDEVGLTQQQVADRVGKQRATVANTLRLLALAKPVQAMVRDGDLSMGHARAVAAVSEPTRQIELAERIARQGLSVRQAERLVARHAEDHGIEKVLAARRRDPNVVAAEQALAKALGTKVRIFEGKKGGRLELYFHDQDELSRIYDLVLRSAEGK